MLITYLDENAYKKKEKALKKYFMKSYKYLIFDAIPKLKMEGKKDGMYQIDLPIDDLFKGVYGAMTMKFSVRNDVTILEDIEPNDILMACFKKDLPCYKGIPYASKKDLKKIKMMEEILCQKKN